MRLGRDPISVREVIGLAIATMIPGALIFTFGIALGTFTEAVWGFQFANEIAVIYAIFFGLPAIAILNALKFYRFLWYIVMSAITAIFLGLDWIAPGYSSLESAYERLAVILFSLGILFIMSALTCAGYWLIARPDRHREA